MLFIRSGFFIANLFGTYIFPLLSVIFFFVSLKGSSVNGFLFFNTSIYSGFNLYSSLQFLGGSGIISTILLENLSALL